MNQTWKLILFYSVIVLLLAFFMPRELDWRPSFSNKHDTPYGAEAIQGTLDEIFNSDISVEEKPLYNSLKDTVIQHSNYLFINADFYIDSLDLSALYRFVAAGNNAFISAENFNREFMDSLGVQLETKFNNFIDLEEMNEIPTGLYVNNTDSAYFFKSQWSNSYFTHQDSTDKVLLGLGRQDSLYNYIKIPYRSGNFFLHTFPYALTNYYLMKESNRSYIASVFSHLPVEYDVIWDEYYKPLRSNAQHSPLSVLMRYRSFRWAYWLIIAGLLFYIIFYGKRRQRPIPIIEPPQNESLGFARTLGGLYYNKGSHKDLFNKKVKVFKEHLRSKYFMKDISLSSEDAKLLSMKSGGNLILIERIFELIKEYEEASSLTDGQIKLVIRKINEFYKKN